MINSFILSRGIASLNLLVIGLFISSTAAANSFNKNSLIISGAIPREGIGNKKLEIFLFILCIFVSVFYFLLTTLRHNQNYRENKLEILFDTTLIIFGSSTLVKSLILKDWTQEFGKTDINITNIIIEQSTILVTLILILVSLLLTLFQYLKKYNADCFLITFRLVFLAWISFLFLVFLIQFNFTNEVLSRITNSHTLAVIILLSLIGSTFLGALISKNKLNYTDLYLIGVVLNISLILPFTMGYKVRIYLIVAIIFYLFSSIFLFKEVLKNTKIIFPLFIVTTGALISFPLKTLFTPADLYHSGEFLVPFNQLINFDKLPYLDITPARGVFVNYLPDAFTFIFLGNNPAYVFWAMYLIYIPVGLCLYRLLQKYLDSPYIEISFLTVIPFLCTNMISVGQCLPLLFILFTYTQSIEGKKYFALFLPFLLFLCIFLSPAEGFIGSFCCVVIFLLNLKKESFLKSILLFLLGATILLINPFRSMLGQSWEYVYDQARINDLAHGILLINSLNPNSPPEIFRSAVLLGVAFMLIVIVKNLKKVNKNDLLLPSILLFYTIFLIPKVYGRIDEGLSRHGFFSILVLSIILPIFVSMLIRKEYLHISLSLFLVLSLALMPSFKGLDSLTNRIKYPFPAFAKTQNNNLLNLDSTVTSNITDRIKALQPIISNLKELEFDFEFVNLTNNSADFRYLKAKSAFRQIAPYNMVTYREQLKSIQITREKDVIYLVDYKSLIGDGGGVSLRNPFLYHEILFNNKLVVCNSSGSLSYWAWPFNLPDIQGCSEVDLNSKKSPWDLPSLEEHNLGMQPFYWGMSIKNNLEELNMDSKFEEYTVLLLEIKCDSTPVNSDAKVYFSSTRYEDSVSFKLMQDGNYLVPLYAYSAFLLAKEVQISFKIPNNCDIVKKKKISKLPLH